MEEMVLFQEFLFVTTLFVLARNYLFKFSNSRTKLRCESCLILIMSMLMIFNVNDVNGVVLVSLLLTVNTFQNFALIVELTLNRQMFSWFILKRQTFLKARSGMSCVMYYFKCEKNLFTDSIWTSYIITTLWMNQWEIFAREFTSDVDSG